MRLGLMDTGAGVLEAACPDIFDRKEGRQDKGYGDDLGSLKTQWHPKPPKQ
jgi:hypothetical protein